MYIQIHFNIALQTRKTDASQWTNNNADPEISVFKLDIHSLVQEVNATVTQLQDIRDATEKDSVLQNLIHFVLVNWPDQKCEVPDMLHHFQLP